MSDNQIELRSTNMVAAAEDLQQLINDLKQSVILSDFAQLNKVLIRNEVSLVADASFNRMFLIVINYTMTS